MTFQRQPERRLALSRRVVDQAIADLTAERDALKKENRAEFASHVDAMINAMQACRFRLNFDT